MNSAVLILTATGLILTGVGSVIAGVTSYRALTIGRSNHVILNSQRSDMIDKQDRTDRIVARLEQLLLRHDIELPKD